MTSRMRYIFPACLMVFVLTLAFVNVAYADEPIWRESNNLYSGQLSKDQWNNFRIYFYQDATPQQLNLQPGTYTLNFEFDKPINNVRMQVVIDGERQTSSGTRPFTFQVPEEFSTLSIFLNSTDDVSVSEVSNVMINSGSIPLPYEPPGFRFDFAAIARSIGQFVEPVLTTILPYIFLMIALIIGINAGIRVFRKTAT